MEKRIEKIPVVALRGITVLPNMLIHFDINRPMTVAAVEKAMEEDQNVFLLTQKNPNIDEPKQEDLYEIGTVATVKQIVKLPGNIMRVMVSVKERAKLVQIHTMDPYIVAEIELIHFNKDCNLIPSEEEAILNSLKDLLEVYCSVNEHVGKNVLKQLMNTKRLEEILDEVCANIPFTNENKMKLLQQTDIVETCELLAILLSNEIEVLRIRKEFQQKVKERVDKNQKEYILREQLKLIREELGETNYDTELEQFEEKLKQLEASQEIKEAIQKEFVRYKNVVGNSSEVGVVRGYIETLLAMPWNKTSDESINIKNAKKILEQQHYGMRKVKDRILEFLSIKLLTNQGEAPILCLVGPPGTGKTSIARSVARAMNKEYVRICLGGVRDEAEIRGHRRTYIGAMPGRIATGLKNVGVSNPVMLLDEIDKVSNDYKGDTFSALLEVLDHEQNSRFIDHYIELPIDLSKVTFIATANDLQTIPRPLLDRMEIIEVSSYTQNEKLHIAQKYLVPKVIERNGLKRSQLSISEKAINEIIVHYTREAGVRNLERKLGEITRKAARKVVEDEIKQVRVNDKNLENYLGKQKFTVDKKNQKDEIGIVRGLAWTSVGGDTLQIEVNIVPGKGRVELTGQLGDVMKESAKAGLSFIRAVGEEYGIQEEYFEKKDIHIHIPEGAVPKDGPSAGITMATAVLSAITNTKVKADIAMTGEITIRGRVLPIGGLKEKILAAKMAEITCVIVPKANEKDVNEMDQEITDGIEIQYVEDMREVVKYAFVKESDS